MTAATGSRTTAASPAGVNGTVRYWAAAKAAAGRAEESFTAGTLAGALAAVRAAHAGRPELLRLLGVCSFLLDGEQIGGLDHAGVPLSEGWTVEVLPPFAGG
ncbi:MULTISPECIES: MoaD/ThiS family protein [Kitasatospora]|uniref:Putative molybdenum cofactor biosynthesis protein n=1 Tax=Kitasatospora setae (strain ATCC 33774 / DSM 43861 / JCM 3304 / KCC A-0304 / NBRC 14216 / KM-6054) TaxID=452652 RepID=E4NF66_KITSK|nr:MoaD/ThiS family protein [Kitasatospora setae]BAJ30146.1 putative molybdenum cofactor biosynthesis protein [Kitasatospora setae KM-6054]